MSLLATIKNVFSKKELDSKKEKIPKSSSRATQRDRFTDRLLHTTAKIIRDYGNFGFDINNSTATELQEHCEGWAKHLTSGAPAPGRKGAADGGKSLPMFQRDLNDLYVFFQQHRSEEQKAVESNAACMNTLISDLTDGLRQSVHEDEVSDQKLQNEMLDLSLAVGKNSLDAVRTQLDKTVKLVSRITEQRQSRYQEQLKSMSERMGELRDDLSAVREKANLDALTKLYNRGAFDNVIIRQTGFSFLSGQPMTLIILDLDHFKEINDTHGHQCGDLVITSVADSIVRVFPKKSDFIARFGGDEFAIILVDVLPADYEKIAERLVCAIRATKIPNKNDKIKLTCSVGIAECLKSDTAETLFARADKALYAAKEKGKDCASIAPVPQRLTSV